MMLRKIGGINYVRYRALENTMTVKELNIEVTELKLALTALIAKVNEQDAVIADLDERLQVSDNVIIELTSRIDFVQDRVQSIDEGVDVMRDVVESPLTHEKQLEVMLAARKVGVEYVESTKPVESQHVVQVDSSAWGAWMSRPMGERANIIKVLGLCGKGVNRGNVAEIESAWADYEYSLISDAEDNNAIDEYHAELDAQIYDRGEMPNGLISVVEQVLVVAGGDNEPF
jgi:chromosome segregation ATPase